LLAHKGRKDPTLLGNGPPLPTKLMQSIGKNPNLPSKPTNPTLPCFVDAWSSGDDSVDEKDPFL